jgi:hypothetical protein
MNDVDRTPIDDLLETPDGDPLDDPSPSSAKAPARRAATCEKFARIPYARARRLFRHIGGPAWLLLLELDRLTLGPGGRNPVKLTTETLQGSGLSSKQKERGLRLLELAGVVTIERKGGRCPLVTFLWYPIRA